MQKESQQVAENDEYWAEEQQQEETVLVKKQPQHIETSYWEWPAEQDAKKATIARILEEERANQLVSGATTESTEQASLRTESTQVNGVKQSNDGYWNWSSPQVAAHTMDETHPNRNYWNWKSDLDKKEHPFQALLEYEAARQMLTADNIVRQLQSQPQPVTSGSCVECSDDYWTWSEEYGDSYWEAQQPAVAATGNAGYRDW